MLAVAGPARSKSPGLCGSIKKEYPMTNSCNKHPKYQGLGKFPKRICGDCKNIWMYAHSNPGDLMTIFNSDGSVMGHQTKLVISPDMLVVGTSSPINLDYNSGPSTWINQTSYSLKKN
jgi:hypothetical protein